MSQSQRPPPSTPNHCCCCWLLRLEISQWKRFHRKKAPGSSTQLHTPHVCSFTRPVTGVNFHRNYIYHCCFCGIIYYLPKCERFDIDGRTDDDRTIPALLHNKTRSSIIATILATLRCLIGISSIQHGEALRLQTGLFWEAWHSRIHVVMFTRNNHIHKMGSHIITYVPHTHTLPLFCTTFQRNDTEQSSRWRIRSLL